MSESLRFHRIAAVAAMPGQSKCRGTQKGLFLFAWGEDGVPVTRVHPLLA